jgi:uncharacterized integral membrane protein (TIGR00698 family)
MGSVAPSNAVVRQLALVSAAPANPSARQSSSPQSRAVAAIRVLPGLGLCFAVTLAAELLAQLEAGMLGRAWIEALVLAIVAGSLVRTVWAPGRRWSAGITFSAKTLLEIAVLLLGASVSVSVIRSLGAELLLGIAAVVFVAIAASYGLSRLLGLPHRLALLVACGNSICGNSAIAAVAPVIGADGEDVASSIAFTAVLGVVVVLSLPLLPLVMHVSAMQYGVLAGLTVYAVPQVLAATAPAGAIAMQSGTLVKLVRVLMLGPVVVVLALLARRQRNDANEPARRLAGGGHLAASRPPLHKLLPWFILGFLALAGLRSVGLVPQGALAPTMWVANWLTVIAMAALGLCTDLRAVVRAGGRVTAAVTFSLLVLGAISTVLIRVVGIG